MRSFIRHPSDIPIAIQQQHGDTVPLHLSNISHGGLALISDTPYRRDTILRVEIDLVEPAFTAQVRVAWCHSNGSQYSIGVTFLEQDDSYTARMVEQVCHIEQYKQDVYRRTGKRISNNQAAAEWISRHAADFPNSAEKRNARGGKG